MDSPGIEHGPPRSEAGDWSSTVIYLKKISAHLQENTVSTTEAERLILFTGTIAVYLKNLTKQKYTVQAGPSGRAV